MLGDLQHKADVVVSDLQGAENGGELSIEAHIDDWADDLGSCMQRDETHSSRGLRDPITDSWYLADDSMRRGSISSKGPDDAVRRAREAKEPLDSAAHRHR